MTTKAELTQHRDQLVIDANGASKAWDQTRYEKIVDLTKCIDEMPDDPDIPLDREAKPKKAR